MEVPNICLVLHKICKLVICILHFPRAYAPEDTTKTNMAIVLVCGSRRSNRRWMGWKVASKLKVCLARISQFEFNHRIEHMLGLYKLSISEQTLYKSLNFKSLKLLCMYYQNVCILDKSLQPYGSPHPYLQVCCSIDSACNNFTQEKDFILQYYEWEFQVSPTSDVTGFQL